jgi:putative transposase
MVTPAARREAVAHVRTRFELSERRACSMVCVDRKVVRYRSRRPADTALRTRMRALAEQRRRFGYRRLHVLLHREGLVANRKRTQRLYREEGLSVRRRRGRKRATGSRAPVILPALPNAPWLVGYLRHGTNLMSTGMSIF